MLGAEVIHLESTPRPGRHPADRGHPGDRGPVVGEVTHLLRAQHQQEERHAGLPDRAGPRTAARADRDLRRHRGELHAAGDRPARPRLRDRAGVARRHRHGAHAGLRPRRPVAGQPGVRLHHRGRLRIELADRVSRPQPVRALLGRRSECGRSRAQRAAAGARAPAADRARVCSSRRRWWTRRSTSPPSR